MDMSNIPVIYAGKLLLKIFNTFKHCTKSTFLNQTSQEESRDLYILILKIPYISVTEIHVIVLSL